MRAIALSVRHELIGRVESYIVPLTGPSLAELSDD